MKIKELVILILDNCFLKFFACSFMIIEHHVPEGFLQRIKYIAS